MPVPRTNLNEISHMDRKWLLVRSVVPDDVWEGPEVRVTTLWTRGSEGFLGLQALSGEERLKTVVICCNKG